MYAARLADSQPLFIQAHNSRVDCVGLAACLLSGSRLWPFSRYCKKAILASLPVTCGERIEDDLAILAAVESELKRRGVSIIMTSSYDSPNSGQVLSAHNYQTEDRSEFTIDLTKDLDEVWKNFKGSRRTDVRRAEKLYVETRQMEIDDGLELVYHFHAISMGRRGADAGFGTRRVSLAKEYLMESGKAIILASFCGGEPLCAAMFGRFDKTAYYLVSGSSVEGNRNRAPVHMLWTAIQRFKKEGCTVFNLGGATESEEGLYRFKRDFGSQIIPAPKGKKTISNFGMLLSRVHPQRLLRRRQPSKKE